MNQQLIIEELVKQLSITQLAMAQVIRNEERREVQRKWTTIVKHWIGRYEEMSEVEWIAGTNSLLLCLQFLSTTDASQAYALLSAEKANGAKIRRLNRIKGRKSSETYKEAYSRLLKEYIPESTTGLDINFHGARRGRIRRLAEIAGEWKSRILRRPHAKKN